jgi:hypothetical protein
MLTDVSVENTASIFREKNKSSKQAASRVLAPAHLFFAS